MTPVKQHAISKTELRAEINAAKASLDTARRLGDALKIELAEDALNFSLDRYHSYHTNQEDQ